MNSNESNPIKPESAEERVKEVHHHHYHRSSGFNFGKLLFGLIIVVFGLAFLARNMGWLPYDLRIDWSLFWPIVVILIIYFLDWFLVGTILDLSIRLR